MQRKHAHSPAARSRRTTSLPNRYEADILEGLEPFAVEELRGRFGDAISLKRSPRPDAIGFDYSGPLDDLLNLRSVVAVYRVRSFAVPRPKAILGHQHFEALVEQIEQVRAPWPSGAFTTFKLSAAGEDSLVLTRLKQELARRTGLQPDPEEGDLLLRLRRTPDGWQALARISPRPLATRPWRVCNMPGAMNATLAYAMMRLTAPQPSDRVLNLACGSGTLLIERLALATARLAIGCDTNLAALECARANLNAAGRRDEARLERWDAGDLPLDNRSVDVICADLPFGQLIGTHRENETLYPRIFAEATRVASIGARMALITHEVRLLEHVAAAQSERWRLDTTIRVRSSGMTPRVYLFRRAS